MRLIRNLFLTRPRALAGILAIAVWASPGDGVPAAGPADGFCLDCLTVRLGRPLVVRGPFPDELDNHFAALRLADGSFRGFSANAVTYAIDGKHVWSMGGARRAVLFPDPEGGVSDCGRWLNSVMRVNGRVYGLVHQERNCNYKVSQTSKSMGVAVSADEGLTWSGLGTVISGRDGAAAGRITGEGDCGWVDGQDGHVYAYCLRNSDWRTIVARAPATDLDPGNWRKFNDGGWNEDARGGAATALGFFGTAAGYLKDFNRVALIANDPWFGGLRLSVSADKVSFTDLKEPILPVDEADWKRPADSDLIAYVSIVNPVDGGNAVGGDFMLAYVYVPPGESFASRYLVFQDVRVSMGREPPPSQVGIALTRWKNSDNGAYRSSSGPVVDAAYRHDRPLGYLLTRQGDAAATIELMECVGDASDQVRYSLAIDGDCAGEGFRRLRTAGWVHTDPRPDTLPLYHCLDASERSHFASNRSDCEGLGAVQSLLGYVLRR